MQSVAPTVGAGAKVACDTVFGADVVEAVAEKCLPRDDYERPCELLIRSMYLPRKELQVPVQFSYRRHIYVVSSMAELYKLARVDIIMDSGTDDFWLETHNRPLNFSRSLKEYGFDGSIHPLKVQFGLNGGSKMEPLPISIEEALPVNEAVALEKRIMSSRVLPLMDIQGAEDTEHANQVMWAHVLKRMNEYATSRGDRSDADLTNDKQWVMCMVENVFQSYYWFVRTDNYLMWAQLVYKLFTGKSSTQAIMDKWHQLFGASEVQGDFKESLHSFRKAFDMTVNLSEHPVLKKFHKLYTYLLVQGFLSRLGLELNENEYSKLEIHALRATKGARAGLWLASLDVLLFLSEKFYEFYETKDVSVFLHTSSEYSKWIKESDRLMALAGFTGNLAPHGTTYFAYLADLDRCIEKGDAYLKYSLAKAGYDSAFMRKRLGALKLTRATTVTIDAASSARKAPYGVLVYGKSGLGKTSVEHMMYYYYASLRGLDNSMRSCYTRNPLVEHWTNFRTSCWCILLDDLAFMKPGVSGEIDPSIKDLILICNMVGYSPAQAALEDKGKTPVMCELVIASGNTIDLNASEYFADPLAVQRRLPHIVTVEVKEQYRKPDSEQLDSDKLDMDPTKYPDYWRFTVSKIQPIMEGRTERALIKPIHVYEHSADFLQDFGINALKHLKSQEDFLACDEYMSKLDVCRTCLRPQYECSCLTVQATEVVQQPWVASQASTTFKKWLAMMLHFCYTMYVAWFMWTLQWKLNLWLLQQFLRLRFTRRLVYSCMLRTLPDSLKYYVLGLMNSMENVPRRWSRLSTTMKAVISIGVVAMAGIAVSGVWKKTTEDTKVVEQKKSTLEVVPEDDEDISETDVLGIQGNKFGTCESQFVKEERQNVWYNPQLETTPVDVPIASQSLVDLDDGSIQKIFGNNVVRLISRYNRANGEIVNRSLNGVYVTSQVVLTEAHLFAEESDIFQMTLIQGPVKDGISGNITFLLKRSELVIDSAKELCVFKVIHNQPKRDLRKFWVSDDDLRVTRYASLTREKSGLLDLSHVRGVERFPQFPIPQRQVVVPMMLGVSDRESHDGDCGAVALATIPRGTIICGLHILGREQRVGALWVPVEVVDALIEKLEISEDIPMDVQCGEKPSTECSKQSFELGPVHYRSKLRYLEGGNLKVYGSMPGYGAHMKSNVCATPLQEEMCEHFNCEVAHCAPCLKGFEPWRNNLVNMVNPCFNVERDLIEECAYSYFQDIISELPVGWEKEVMFLSKRAAVNGLPGVRYIDGINRTSSMGFPFNTSKKEYLIADVSAEYPEGVTMTDEVWQEYDRIVKCYQEGKRANPVFAAHLKDEAVTLQKRDIKKTRVFTGSPCAWSLVVRSRLLSFVRLVQKNKFAFEAAPGVVTMSSEWGRLRSYLTSFGEDRIIAGDYGHYDKDMIAFFIVQAFVVIGRIYKAAGFSKQECREIMCIGYDTAFSWCNFDGDLVEFFGTNPSGHPLTVIVNSLVNSLYMRFAYRKMNPLKEVRSFKKNVHLITYGDDNAAGVRRGVDWFNHTAIVAALKSIGLTYTMADKNSESVPFINISEVSFLKRTWRWNDEVNSWLCPLSEESIHKALTVWTASKTIDPDTQMCAVITAMHDEFFFYGRERFEKEHKFFAQILEREQFAVVPNIQLLSFDQLADRYRRCSEDIDKEYQVYDATHGGGTSCV